MSCLMKHKFDNNCAVYMRIDDDEHEPLPGTCEEQASKLLRNIYGWDIKPCDWEKVLENPIGLPDLVIVDDVYVCENFAFKAPSKEYPFPLTEVSHKFVKGENGSLHDDIIYIVKEEPKEVTFWFSVESCSDPSFSMTYNINLSDTWKENTPLPGIEIYFLITGGVAFPEMVACGPIKMRGRREEGLYPVLRIEDLKHWKILKVEYARDSIRKNLFVKIPAYFPFKLIDLGRYIEDYLWVRYGYNHLNLYYEIIDPVDVEGCIAIDWQRFISEAREIKNNNIEYYYDYQKNCYYRHDKIAQPNVFIPKHYKKVQEIPDISQIPGSIIPNYELVTVTFDTGLGIPSELKVIKESCGAPISTFLKYTIPGFVYHKYGKRVGDTEMVAVVEDCKEGDTYKYTEDDLKKIIKQKKLDLNRVYGYKGSCTNCKRLGKVTFGLPYCRICENKDLWEAKE